MSKVEKLIKRLLSCPKDFTYSELTSLLKLLGYTDKESGKTSGSRVTLANEPKGRMIKILRPPKTEVEIAIVEELERLTEKDIFSKKSKKILKFAFMEVSK